MKLLFVDTETTGLPLKWGRPVTEVDNWPRVIEVGAVAINTEDRVISKVGFLIQPKGFEIPEAATKVHGISTEMAMTDGVEPEKGFAWLHSAMVEADHIAGHNIRFDMDCLGAEFHRLEFEQPQVPRICTMFGTKHLFGKWPKLSELHYKAFKLEFQDAHRALADITATARCFFRFVEVGLWPELGISPELAREILEIVSRETIDGEPDATVRKIG